MAWNKGLFYSSGLILTGTYCTMASIKGHHKRVQIDVWLDKKRGQAYHLQHFHTARAFGMPLDSRQNLGRYAQHTEKSLPFLLPRLVEWFIRMVLLLDFFWLLHVLWGIPVIKCCYALLFVTYRIYSFSYNCLHMIIQNVEQVSSTCHEAMGWPFRMDSIDSFFFT
jgi:hypothetical protein